MASTEIRTRDLLIMSLSPSPLRHLTTLWTVHIKPLLIRRAGAVLARVACHSYWTRRVTDTNTDVWHLREA